MKKLNFTILLLFIFSFYVNAQEQFENPGFEDWEAITDQFSEPVNWSTIKTCIPDVIAGIAPVPLEKETENVHSGSAAIHLITKPTMSTAANGMITNGRVFASIQIEEGYTFIDPEHEEWHTILTRKPDSVAGWFRSNPMPGDYGAIKVVIASDSTAVPANDSSAWVGYGEHFFSSEPVGEWTRFSFPITYFNNNAPKYVHAILFSSRGFEATAGSEIWFDDLELIYNENNSIKEITDNNINIYTRNNRLFVYINTTKNEKLHLNIVDMQGRVLTDDVVYTNRKQNIELNIKSGVYVALFSSDSGEKLSKKIFIRNN